ncbi:MAG: ABC transporter permease subunit [Actinobacteria bacterium]|nr:ABC transporter permease subunit [Actinomycetota bacterium]
MPNARAYKKAAWIFLVIYLICILVPIAITVAWAFTDYWPWPSLFPLGFSTRGLAEIFNSYSPVGGILLQSIFIALAVSFLAVVIAALSARALVHHDFFGKELFRFTTILPFLIPVTVFAMGVQVAFIRMGLANTVVGVIIAHTIVALPYATVIITDVTAATGARLEEQARVLGADKLQTLAHVTVPSLLPGILSAASMSYILSFSQYFLTLLIGGGTVKTFAVVMFPFLASGDRTIASAYGLVFLGVTFIVFLLFESILKRLGMREHQSFFS